MLPTRRRAAAVASAALRYAAQVIAVVLVVGLGSSLLIHLVPGDPAVTILGQRANPANLAALRRELGLDRTVMDQMLDTAWRLAHLDLGNSLVERGRSVSSIIVPALSVTAVLTLLTLVIATVIGIPLGLASALSRGGRLDGAIRFGNVLLLSFPPFFAGLVLLLVVALGLRLAPAGGWAGEWPANFGTLWLPSLALSVYLIPLISRAVGHAAREALQEPYIAAAIARGLPRRVVVLNHVLPNSLLPVVTLIGYNAASLVAGAVVIEAVFALPGIGSRLVEAVSGRDFPVVTGIAVITGVAVVLVNVVTDLVYAMVDPRVRR